MQSEGNRFESDQIHQLMKDKDLKNLILEHFSNPKGFVSMNKLESISNFFSLPINHFNNFEGNCSDFFYLIVGIENNIITKLFYCSEECCMLSSVLASIFYSHIFEKDLSYVKNIFFNFKYNRCICMLFYNESDHLFFDDR